MAEDDNKNMQGGQQDDGGQDYFEDDIEIDGEDLANDELFGDDFGDDGDDDDDDISGDDSGAGDDNTYNGNARAEAEAKGMSFAPETANFDIPDFVYAEFPEMVNLIIGTESMNDEERQYWFQIMPIMTEDQIVKFKEILVSEKQQLQQLDQEYESELNKLNNKHMQEWKEFEVKEKRRKLEEAEKASEEAEKAKEEELLKQLDEL